MDRISNPWFAIRTWLIALMPILPAVAALASVVLFLANWPQPGNRGLQLVVALGIAVLAWILTALLIGPEVTNVETASSDSYEDLRGRVRAFAAALHTLKPEDGLPQESLKPEDGLPQESKMPLYEAAASLETLETDLCLNGHTKRSYGTRWLLGHGYVNAWRELHTAEDHLLIISDPKVAWSVIATKPDLAPIEKLVYPEPGIPTLEVFEARGGRQVVGRQLAQLHSIENDAWDKIVNLRNRLFLAFVLAIALTYGLIVLAVLRDVTVPMMTAAVAFFLVGAIVGVFNELYSISRPYRKGSVFDYGLGHIRLLTTPVLSGLAGLGGVLITTMTGPFLVATGGTAASAPDITAVFSLHGYSMGLIVAAIFGLTPGLFLTKLRDRTDAYNKEIEEASPGSPAATSPSQPNPLATAPA